jgi:glycosyltransferase A (GT-A) superfamily protein (DUF2064 family)
MSVSLTDTKFRRGALAVFVKTPELSPVKTRLAANIGTAQAVEFYQLAVAATKAVMQKLKQEFNSKHNFRHESEQIHKHEIPQLEIYFAVAEPEGLASPLWSGVATLEQGEGSLGTRLAHVYSQLCEHHDYVCLMGADSPHLAYTQVYEAILMTNQVGKNNFVIGETVDGGFYFFGGSLAISKKSWESITYSSVNTAQDLIAEFSKFASFKHIQNSFDIDTFADLKRYGEKNFPLDNLLPEQHKLIQWVREF